MQNAYLTRNEVLREERENQYSLAIDFEAFRENIALPSSRINVSVFQRSQRIAGFHFSVRLLFSRGSDGMARDKAGQLG